MHARELAAYRRRGRQGGGGFVLVVVLLLVCFGPKLFREFFPNPDRTDSACATVATLDTYKLPATSGRTGNEASINDQGVMPHGERVTFTHFAKLGQEYRDYYITMRWNYAEWFWDGASKTIDPKQRDWMQAKPRLVVVTNSKKNRKIIAIALEAGPAPWAGVDPSKNNIPKQGWRNPQTNETPSGYTGRVSGFPPKAIGALDAVQGKYTGEGDVLDYAWAADQTAKPGPCNM
ncbi:MAG TPA: hypothetical protein VFT87_00725 [Candidatus Saccharimonadales bacterium]|nr:hypothetical protein [Candidatus Saccharimonadales bacterium]